MARISLNNLPKEDIVSKDEMKNVKGGMSSWLSTSNLLTGLVQNEASSIDNMIDQLANSPCASGGDVSSTTQLSTGTMAMAGVQIGMAQSQADMRKGVIKSMNMRIMGMGRNLQRG